MSIQKSIISTCYSLFFKCSNNLMIGTYVIKRLQYSKSKSFKLFDWSIYWRRENNYFCKIKQGMSLLFSALKKTFHFRSIQFFLCIFNLELENWQILYSLSSSGDFPANCDWEFLVRMKSNSFSKMYLNFESSKLFQWNGSEVISRQS